MGYRYMQQNIQWKDNSILEFHIQMALVLTMLNFCYIFDNHKKKHHKGEYEGRGVFRHSEIWVTQKLIYTRRCVPSFVQFSVSCRSYQYKFSTTRLCLNGKTLGLDHGL